MSNHASTKSVLVLLSNSSDTFILLMCLIHWPLVSNSDFTVIAHLKTQMEEKGQIHSADIEANVSD